jgi:hypothetical protein
MSHGRASNAPLVVATLIALLVCRNGSAVTSPRSWEPLVMAGAKFPQLLGVREDRLEVLAINHGRCEPIPFQIDERRGDGRYVMPNGPLPVASDEPGILRASDELVLMVTDMASSGAHNQCLKTGTLEIEATDPLGGPPRYAYIDAVDSPRLTTRKYIYYDPNLDRIETDFYRIGLTRGWPTDFALQDRIHCGAPDLIDRFKVRTVARILKVFSYQMNEDDIRNRLLAWKMGPIRMLRLESHSVNLLFGIRSPEVRSQVFLYRNYLEAPTRVSFAWVPRLILNHVRVRLDVDYLNLDGFVLTWSGMTLPPVVVGSNSLAEHEISSADDRRPVEWIALRGDGRLLLQTLRPSPDLKLISRTLYYRNSTAADLPERYPGEHPGVGYITTGYRNLSSGSHTFDSLFIIAPGSCDPWTLMHEIETPLAVRVH